LLTIIVRRTTVKEFDYFEVVCSKPSEDADSKKSGAAEPCGAEKCDSEEEFDYFAMIAEGGAELSGAEECDSEEEFDYFAMIAEGGNAPAKKRARVERMIADTAALGGGGSGQGNPTPHLARVTDSRRLHEIHDELGRDLSLKCDFMTKQTRHLKTACNRHKKCRQLMLAEAFENDTDLFKASIQIARRKYTGPERKVFIREVLNIGNRHDPKKRIMQLHGVDICLSFWTFFYGFSKYMVGEVLGEIKRPEDNPVRGDMRLVPKLKEWTIERAVVKWFKIYVDELTQDCPEHLEGDRDNKPRKFLGGIKVRGVLYQMYLQDRLEDMTGELLFCAVGYFKTLFSSQFGRKTGPANGNFWVTDAIRSLMGGYCKKCSASAVMISSMDKLTRDNGKERQMQHIRIIKKIAQNLASDQKDAASFVSLVEGDDAATAAGTALPIMRKIAQKFVKGRVPFKIMQLVLFSNKGHPRFCLRAVSAPWVQTTGNLQVHCMLYCSLPAMIQHYFDMKMPVPRKYVRWSDGGGDTWNLTLLTTAYLLAKEKCFDDVFIKRPEKDHSHNVWDWCVSVQQKGLRFTPGKGALTFELLMKHLRELSNADAV
jgi:hypothetical protein